MENKNMLQKLFGFNSHSMQVRTEILAGITTFLTMSYILAVNPSILGVTGMDKGAVFTATATASLIATLIMAVWAKLPFALAPGMGLNAFFAFTVCLGMGNTWEFALTAVLIEGLLFILLTLSNLREAILNAIPDSLKNAIGAGIGLFIAFIGLQNAGVITKNDATLVTLGNITSGSPLLALIGLAITSVLLIKKVKGSMLWGILLTMLIGIPMGITEFNGIVSIPPSLEPVFFKFDFSKVLTTQMAFTVFTLLFIDMFDTIGTLVGVSREAPGAGPGVLPDCRPQQSGACRAGIGGMPSNRHALLPAAYRHTASASVRNRENRRRPAARGALRPHQPPGGPDACRRSGSRGAGAVPLPGTECVADGRLPRVFRLLRRAYRL